METAKLELNEDAIVVPRGIKILVRMHPKKSCESGVSKLKGMLKEYKSQYSSVELQKKSMGWWKNVSD
ncbi:hypothetical protein BEH94_04340 [Candidatus Altiarchaeales archaeon WOR_SM1_SCG]|nr:hypothetical protein BEH94_04340 [Candidatus Altiarchaeales archaeon WOR_SM1_SCG]